MKEDGVKHTSRKAAVLAHNSKTFMAAPAKFVRWLLFERLIVNAGNEISWGAVLRWSALWSARRREDSNSLGAIFTPSGPHALHAFCAK